MRSRTAVRSLTGRLRLRFSADFEEVFFSHPSRPLAQSMKGSVASHCDQRPLLREPRGPGRSQEEQDRGGALPQAGVLSTPSQRCSEPGAKVTSRPPPRVRGRARLVSPRPTLELFLHPCVVLGLGEQCWVSGSSGRRQSPSPLGLAGVRKGERVRPLRPTRGHRTEYPRSTRGKVPWGLGPPGEYSAGSWVHRRCHR